MMLRCAKCGSDAGFLVETRDGRTLEVRGQLGTDRIKRNVLATCTYCNHRWDQGPTVAVEARVELVPRTPELVH
jgi:DNA-directed RNA polymerase subunit RPC12/RpoP